MTNFCGVTKKHGPCSTPTGGYVCWSCTKSLHDQLLKVPWLIGNLEITVFRLDKHAPTARNGGKGSGDKPLMFNDAVSVFLEGFRNEISAVYMQIARHHVTRAGDTAPVPRSRAWACEQAIADADAQSVPDRALWLAKKTVYIANHVDGPRIHDTLSGHIARGIVWIDRPQPPTYWGPCPTPVDVRDGHTVACGTDLYADPDTDEYATCPRCRTSHRVSAIKGRLMERIDGELLTAAEVLTVMRTLGESIPRSSFYAMVAAKKITPAGWKHNGRVTEMWIHRDDPPVYRLGTVRKARTASVHVRK